LLEHDEQKYLFDRVRLSEEAIPELKLLFAIPNGGLRSKATAGKMKAEGVRSGVPDLFLAFVQAEDWTTEHVWPGLWIEMKVGRNKPTEAQLWWHEQLREQGYRVEVCYNWIEAWNTIMQYLNHPEHRIEP
jgi:hypothetical protein